MKKGISVFLLLIALLFLFGCGKKKTEENEVPLIDLKSQGSVAVEEDVTDPPSLQTEVGKEKKPKEKESKKAEEEDKKTGKITVVNPPADNKTVNYAGQTPKNNETANPPAQGENRDNSGDNHSQDESTDTSAEKASEKQSEKASEKTSEKRSEKASEKTSEKASEKTSEKQSDKPDGKTKPEVPGTEETDWIKEETSEETKPEDPVPEETKPEDTPSDDDSDIYVFPIMPIP